MALVLCTRPFNSCEAARRHWVLHSHYYRHEGVRLRFFQEAQAIGTPTDPHTVVKLIRFGEIPMGQPLPGCGGYFFMAQEFIAGETLRQVRTRSAPTAERAVAIARQVLRGLADAHRQGLVHRDLKPSNIMLTQDVWGQKRSAFWTLGWPRCSKPSMNQRTIRPTPSPV